MEVVVVLGGGSFGTALGQVLARKGYSVTILTRDENTVKSINENHRNPKYLTDLTLSENLNATTDLNVVRRATTIVHAVPVQDTTDYLTKIVHLIPKTAILVSASKGIHATELTLMSDILPQILGADQPIAYLSGPSFARELILNVPTAVVVAAHSDELVKKCRRYSCSQLSVSTLRRMSLELR